ncbi:hypothetical protein [Ensifer sp. ENS10]|uniref:hypothetical protein n=1 Tax=Ensifer sp. ENS10 TaxID=2769286 RepID=UPI001FF05B7F|nr:hypothetical protein [Ensifer sp. ENS10]
MPPVTASATLDPDLLLRQSQARLLRAEWSRERLLAFQRSELQSALRHAVGASTYYRESIGELVASGAPFHAFRC